MTTFISPDKSFITVTWTIEDIINYDCNYGDKRRLTVEGAKEVLWLMKENFDMDEGITWNSIERYRDHMLREDED